MNARATRFPLFDSLRAIAALAVFGTHAYYLIYSDAAGWLQPYASRLDVGVYIFFVISGFLLYRPFVRARLRDEGSPSARAYAWRRLLRIGPAYWVALTIVSLWLGFDYVFEPDNALWLYTFSQSYQAGGLAIGGLTQAWSLSVEAAFYVMIPLYALLMRSLPVRGERRLQAELAGLAALAVLGIASTTYAAESGMVGGRLDVLPLHLTLPAFLHVFAAGMLLAALSVWYADAEPAWLRPLDRFPGLAWGVAILAFWIVSTRIGIDGHDGESYSTAQWVGKSALYALIGLALVIPAVFGDQARGVVRKVLANRVLLWVGLVSYSLFLYHVAVVTQVERWNLPAQGPVALGLSLAVAAASYYLIERPALSLKRLVKGSPEPPRGEAIEEPAPPAPARV